MRAHPAALWLPMLHFLDPWVHYSCPEASWLTRVSLDRWNLSPTTSAVECCNSWTQGPLQSSGSLMACGEVAVVCLRRPTAVMWWSLATGKYECVPEGWSLLPKAALSLPVASWHIRDTPNHWSLSLKTSYGYPSFWRMGTISMPVNYPSRVVAVVSNVLAL